jgi:excinuclease ABC subunit A
VEHDEEIILAADYVVEIGPAAGEAGGQITFLGTPQQLRNDQESLTGRYLSRLRDEVPANRRPTRRGWIKLLRARGHNLQNVDVAFPLGVLTVVTGVSGSGKTSLVDGTLYPALCKRKRKKAPPALPYDEIVGDGQFDDVILVDQSPLGRSPRSNPITYIKAFDEIRKLFAESMYARMRNLSPGHFSFNVDGGGRCPTCEGDGVLTIDMHFLPDVQVNCPDCNGQRYRPDILEIHYRGRSIYDVLMMTVREAYVFFRGQQKVQSRLQYLMDVGLEYVRLGQPASTLSAGEAQRLKLASHLGATRRSRTVFLMDEPSRGLHFHDVVKLMDCFDALLSVGHSLIVVEHDLRLLKAADYVIELGPGAASEGGRVVVAGPPEEVARCEDSPTAPFLRTVLPAVR